MTSFNNAYTDPLLSETRNGNTVLSSPYSAQVSKNYILSKQKKYQNNFDIQFHEANLHEEFPLSKIIAREQRAVDPNKPKFLMLRTKPIGINEDGRAVHSIGAVLYQGKVYLTGTINIVDRKDNLGQDNIKQYYQPDELSHQVDDVSCDLVAYKQAKYLIKALENIRLFTKIENNGEHSLAYIPPEENKKYYQKYCPEYLKDHEKQWKILKKDTSLTISGNSRLAARNIKRFLMFASRERLTTWVANNDSRVNDALKSIISEYISENQSQEEYLERVKLHFQQKTERYITEQAGGCCSVM